MLDANPQGDAALRNQVLALTACRSTSDVRISLMRPCESIHGSSGDPRTAADLADNASRTSRMPQSPPNLVPQPSKLTANSTVTTSATASAKAAATVEVAVGPHLSTKGAGSAMSAARLGAGQQGTALKNARLRTDATRPHSVFRIKPLTDITCFSRSAKALTPHLSNPTLPPKPRPPPRTQKKPSRPRGKQLVLARQASP